MIQRITHSIQLIITVRKKFTEMFPFEVILATSTIILLIMFLYFTALRQLEPDFQDFNKGGSNPRSEKPSVRKETDHLSEKLPKLPQINPLVSTSNTNNREMKCSHFIGYLAERPKGESIPNECFGCTQVVKCMKLRPSRAIESYYVDQIVS